MRRGNLAQRTSSHTHSRIENYIPSIDRCRPGTFMRDDPPGTDMAGLDIVFFEEWTKLELFQARRKVLPLVGEPQTFAGLRRKEADARTS
ncbi:MAG: hypothetical protein ABIG68_06325 [Acidobacteriota bacterium]